MVSSASNRAAITSEKDGMQSTRRNLGVCHTLIQRWNVALSLRIVSTSNSTAITSYKRRMNNTSNTTCRHLGVCHAVVDRWNVASVPSASNCTAISSKKYCVTTTRRNLGVCHPLI
ncbi:unnamed protein product [Cladocopium goreaui]|uniref:Uncharacterized protein n=1 Tax=Cladocopium goreaui TaxID=2562237 RepID=A0A9P1BJQ5_9DINO|nr:unnamed protein product [Cladocopium goreaui]